MSQRSTYLMQIMEKIGAPLLAAIDDVRAKTPAQEPPVDAGAKATEDAKTMAALLSRSIQMSIELAKLSDLDKAPAETGEALRVSLAALSGPIIAEQYRSAQKVPDDAEMSRIMGMIDALISFSANFSPSEETNQRLENLDARGQSVDSHQINVQIMQLFVPVLAAIQQFPFGQQEKKLVQEVSQKLLAKAQELRENFFTDVTDEDRQKVVELGLIKALAEIYTQCHQAEMQRMSAEPAAADPSGLEKVWADFDLRAEMIHTLGASILGQDSGIATQSTAAPAETPAQTPAEPATPTPPPAAPTTQPEETQAEKPAIFQATPTAEKPADPPSVPVSPPPEQTQAPPPAAAPASEEGTSSAGGSPMGFFAKKPAEGAVETPPTEPTAPPTEQAAPPPPPAETPPQAPAETPAETPPPPPPTEPPSQEDSAGESGSGAPPGSPMGFFAKKKDEGDES